MKLRSIELSLPKPEQAKAFLLSPWGMAAAGEVAGVTYLRGSGDFPYLVALAEGPEPAITSTTFVGDESEVGAIGLRAASEGAPVKEVESTDLGGGRGILVQMPEGEVLRFLHNASTVQPIHGRDLPVKLTHIVMNSADAEATGSFAERVLGFHVSDRTNGMVFVRCNQSHHSVAFARAGYPSLNHIAFEMADIDAVMRGIGRMRDSGASPAWGPGRHGPGDNVFAYFISPFGAVVEFSTAVEQVSDDYRVGSPTDWTWPPNRIDQWGMSNKDLDSLKIAEQTFRYRPFAPIAREKTQ